MTARRGAVGRARGGGVEELVVDTVADQRVLDRRQPPRLGADAADGDPRLPDHRGVDVERDCGGHERELEARAVAHLQVVRAPRVRGGRNQDGRDQVAGVEHRLDLRRVARHAMQRLDRQRARPLRAVDHDVGVEHDERDREVTGVRRDAVRARAEDRVEAVLTVERGAARARRAFVARRDHVAEVDAAGALQQVAADRRHVAHLRARAQQQRLGDGRILRADPRMIGDVAHARGGADPNGVRVDLDAVERQPIDIDELGRHAHALLQQLQHVGAACDELGAAPPRDVRDRGIGARGGGVGEGHHRYAASRAA